MYVSRINQVVMAGWIHTYRTIWLRQEEAIKHSLNKVRNREACIIALAKLRIQRGETMTEKSSGVNGMTGGCGSTFYGDRGWTDGWSDRETDRETDR